MENKNGIDSALANLMKNMYKSMQELLYYV